MKFFTSALKPCGGFAYWGNRLSDQLSATLVSYVGATRTITVNCVGAWIRAKVTYRGTEAVAYTPWVANPGGNTTIQLVAGTTNTTLAATDIVQIEVANADHSVREVLSTTLPSGGSVTDMSTLKPVLIHYTGATVDGRTSVGAFIQAQVLVGKNSGSSQTSSRVANTGGNILTVSGVTNITHADSVVIKTFPSDAANDYRAIVVNATSTLAI